MVNLFYNKKNIKGQAAIEFLMTYGWMLLVVLIVGALIFSIVDFGQLLPNTVDLNNNFRGIPSEVRATESGQGVLVAFDYNGNQRVTIDPQDNRSSIAGELGEECNLTWIKNTVTDVSINKSGAGGVASPNYGIPGGSSPSGGNAPYFLRSHSGIAEYQCNANDLVQNGVLEGIISLRAVNQKTDFPILSRGNFRVSIEE